MSLSLTTNGCYNYKIGIKMLLNCLPAQPVPIFREMYIKISNVSTDTQLSELSEAIS